MPTVFANDDMTAAYYGPSFLKSPQSKESINKIMNDNKPRSISYDQARKVLFNNLYLGKDSRGYFVKDIYCARNLYSEELAGGAGPNSIPSSNQMNIEHTWPQSKFSSQFSKDVQKTDLHHLFPSNSHTNSQRGNLNFSEVVANDSVDDCQASNLGHSKLKDDGHQYFEPAPDHRGNVARALFYFSVRYKSIINPTEEYYLRKWHDEDPVDDLEKSRHEEIYKIQNVRNPFIDYPQLVDTIDNF
jgi:hypothetical protein